MPISSNHQSTVIWVWISVTLPRISDAIWGTPNPVESSKLWNLGFFPFAHRLIMLITEVNATDALHCQQICVVLLASIAFFMFLLCFFGFLDLCPSTCWYQWLLRGWRVCRARTPRIARPLVFSLHGRHSRVEPWQSIFFYIKLVLSTSFLRTRVRLVWLHLSMILDCLQQCCEVNFQSCFKLRREQSSTLHRSRPGLLVGLQNASTRS